MCTRNHVLTVLSVATEELIHQEHVQGNFLHDQYSKQA